MRRHRAQTRADVAALIHDVGKLLLLTGEDPANVVCTNWPIGEYDDGCGLDQCVFQWNHAEQSRHLMDARDRTYNEQCLTAFLSPIPF